MNEFRPTWKRVIAVLATVSVAAASALYAKSTDDWRTFLPVLGTASAASAAVGFLWYLFVRWGWTCEIKGFRIFGSVAPQPNLNGRWIGVLKSPHMEECLPIAIEIRQSFVHIDCQIWTASNRSHSLASSLLCSQETKNFRLVYTYEAEALPGKDSDGHRHIGTTLLELTGDRVSVGSKLTGSYFTERTIPSESSSRQTKGEVYLYFEGRERRGELGDVDVAGLMHLVG